ncbi:MAG: serine/threonine-protein kinase [Gemmatimonadales bacterium]
MDSTAERFQEVKRLFDAALERSPETRDAFLDAECGPDTVLRQEVAELLAAAHEDDDPFEAPAPAAFARLPEDPAEAMIGRRIGVYEVTGLIGFGGMGAVYEAVRADDTYQKRVAIKLIKRGMDTDLAVRRFKHERQILANLNHRNIAALLDGGVTEDGRPYFVMEYVEGEPITGYCDRQRLSVQARVELFRQVCNAVEHAHRNLVVHRDLKPGNILVAADGTVKLLDFGIAKLLGEEESPESAPLTRGGFRALTPEYASPEMVRGEPITTAADVYGLGVVLFELLAGRRPFRFDQLTLSGIEELVCRTPAPKPSTLATEQMAWIAGSKSTGRLAKQLAGDLDTIVQMALRKEPERRYPSVEALSEDLKRYLQGLPVSAQRDRWSYRSLKFARRHPIPLATGVLLLASVVTGLLVTTATARRAERERARAQQINDFLIGMLQSPDPEVDGRHVTVVQLLDSAAHRVATELADQPETLAEIQSTLGYSYLALGQVAEAEQQIKASLAIRRELYGERDDRIIILLNNLANTYDARGSFLQADSVLTLATSLYRRSGTDRDTLYALLADNLGRVKDNLGDFAASERYHRESVEIQREVHGTEHEAYLIAVNNLAVTLGNLGRWAEAVPMHREAVVVGRKVFGNDRPELAGLLSALAGALDLNGETSAADSAFREAIDISRRTLGPEHPTHAWTQIGYASMLVDDGRYEDGIRVCREILANRGGSLTDEHPAIGAALLMLGRSLGATGDQEGAGRALEEAVEVRRRVLPAGHWLIASAEVNLGELWLQTGQDAKARPLLEQAAKVLAETRGETQVRTQLALKLLGDAYERTGRPEQASAVRARLVDEPTP